MTDTLFSGRIRRELPGLHPEQVSDLARSLGCLVDTFEPDYVYVFGSQARGQATPDSDVDLLVVVSHSDLPRHRRAELAHEVVGWHSVPLDIFVLTREEFDRRARAATSLPATVLREGRTLYVGRA